MDMKLLVEDTVTGLDAFLVKSKSGKELFVYNSQEALSRYLKSCGHSADISTLAHAIRLYTLLATTSPVEFKDICQIFNTWKENPEFVNKIELEYYNQ